MKWWGRIVLIPDAATTSEYILPHLHDGLQRTLRIVLFNAGVTIVVLTVKNVLGQQTMTLPGQLIDKHNLILVTGYRLAVRHLLKFNILANLILSRIDRFVDAYHQLRRRAQFVILFLRRAITNWGVDIRLTNYYRVTLPSIDGCAAMRWHLYLLLKWCEVFRDDRINFLLFDFWTYGISLDADWTILMRLINTIILYSSLCFEYLLIVSIAHVSQFFQVLVLGHVFLVTLILPYHVTQLIVLVLQLDQSVHALLEALLLVQVPLPNVYFLPFLCFLLLHNLSGNGFLPLILSLFKQFLCSYLFFLYFAHLMCHVIQLCLKYEVFQRFVPLRQIDTNLAGFIVQRALERPSNNLRIDVTVILVEVVANKGKWERIVGASLETKAMVALLINLDHSLLDIRPLRLGLQPLRHFLNIKPLNFAIVLHRN